MYLDHYQLMRMPFDISPDPQFLWLGDKHKEAFAILQYGVLENKGFIVLIGEPGTGKTTLLNAIIGSFGTAIRFAKIADPAMSEMDFFNFAANAFEMSRTFDNKADFLIHLQKYVSDTAARSGKVVLVIDEAQRLAPELLEQIRILANFDGPDQKAIRCIFAGQNEFLGMLKQNQALSQRIFFSHILHPLTEAEAEAYITHRLKVAGAKKPIFRPSAMRAVCKLARGNPRLINIICDHALLNGYSCCLKAIGPDIIRNCAEETLIQRQAGTEPGTAQNDGASSTEAEAKQDAVDAAADPGRKLPQLTPAVFNLRAAYLALAAVVILMGTAYGHFSGVFNALLSSTQSTSSSDSVDRNNIKTEILSQTAEKTEAGQSRPGIAQLQAQHLEVNKQKRDVEGRRKDFHTKFDSNENDERELTTVRSQAAKLESEVHVNERELAAASQKLIELEKALANENDKKDRLNAASNRATLQDEMAAIKKESTRLQAQLVEVTNPKNGAQARLGEEQKQNTGDVIDAKKMKAARDRAVRLEAAISGLEKKLTQFEQKLGEFEKEIAKDKEQKAEADIPDTQRKNLQHQSKMQEFKAPKPVSPSLPLDSSDKEIDPARVIDFVIKKKSQ